MPVTYIFNLIKFLQILHTASRKVIGNPFQQINIAFTVSKIRIILKRNIFPFKNVNKPISICCNLHDSLKMLFYSDSPFLDDLLQQQSNNIITVSEKFAVNKFAVGNLVSGIFAY